MPALQQPAQEVAGPLGAPEVPVDDYYTSDESPGVVEDGQLLLVVVQPPLTKQGQQPLEGREGGSQGCPAAPQ